MPADFFEPISNNGTPPTYKYFNGSDWADSVSKITQEVHSPVDQSVVGILPVVTKEEIDKAINAVITSQREWEKTPLYQRVKVVHLAADWIRQEQEYLTALMVREIGKSIGESTSEIIRTADLIDYYADEVQSMKGETLNSDNFPGFDKGRIAVIERVAYGAVLAIAPFNYPVNLTASKITPALLMGNGVVCKPPTQGGISALHLIRIFQKSGVPPGVMVALTGGGAEIGDYLVSHPGISMIAFTGSSDTGVKIASKAAMTPLLFECGGNNPAIVLPDADMKLAAREIIKGAFSYSGQRCTAIKYVLGMQAVLDALLPIILEMMGELVHMGDPRSPETKLVGPVVSESVAGYIDGVIKEAQSQGATVVAGGKRNGAYIEATVLTNVKPSMKVVADEIFGPVLSFVPVTSMDEVIQIVRESKFGLQACVFTKDEGTGLSFASNLNVGTVQINGSPQRGPDHFPFLGVKRSGVGVQGVRYSLEAMSRLKPVVLNKPQ